MPSIKDRFIGSIVGAAIGDALGMPTEYISKAQLNALYAGKVTTFVNPSEDHPCSHLGAGQYTDDTQQVIILAESLIAKNGFDLQDFAARFGVWGHRCRSEAGYDRYSGGTSISAALKLYNGENPLSTGIARATCGSAMRIAPIGLLYHSKSMELVQFAKLASIISHTHPAAIDSAVFIAQIIANVTNGLQPEQAAHHARSVLNSDLATNIDFILQNYTSEPQESMKSIGASESSYQTIPMALHCFLHTPQSFESTVVEAANLVPGDTDSIACIAGAMSGAYNGIGNIPSKFLQGLEEVRYLQELGDKLYKVYHEH